jgi:hypothetical protein
MTRDSENEYEISNVFHHEIIWEHGSNPRINKIHVLPHLWLGGDIIKITPFLGAPVTLRSAY